MRALLFVAAVAFAVDAGAEEPVTVVDGPTVIIGPPQFFPSPHFVTTPAVVTAPGIFRLPVDAPCPHERPALFFDEATAKEQAARLASAEAERDALRGSHIDGRAVAALVISGIAFGAAVGAAVAAGIHELNRSR